VTSGGPYLEHRRYLCVRGRDEDRAPLEMAFDWYNNPLEEHYEEAEMMVRFAQRRVRRRGR